MHKHLIRQAIKARKCLLDEAERRASADDVFSRLEAEAAFIMADRILIYRSLTDELPTEAFISRWAERKHFYLPRVNGIDLDILPYDRAHMHIGAFNIEEPDGNDLTDIDSIELIIVPGVAYDSECNRVGRGKGYYDRLLRRTRATTIGVGFDFQVVDNIDVEPHDIALNMVITPSRTYRRRRDH